MSHSNKWLVSLFSLLAVGVLVLSACGGGVGKVGNAVKPAADLTTTPITQVAIAGGIAAAEADLAAPLTGASCTYLTGCILREEGSNSQWWADSWERGICRDHDPSKGEDWIATYNVNNDQWRNADPSKIRFYAAVWSAYWFWKWANELQVEDNVLSSGGGIKVCLSGDLPSIEVKGTYLWLQP
jgi:hypothetical protein